MVKILILEIVKYRVKMLKNQILKLIWVLHNIIKIQIQIINNMVEKLIRI